MLLNQELNLYLVKYLSNKNFKACEFKKIFYGFTKEYPKFSCRNDYQRIYRIVRLMVTSGLMILKPTNHNYKYTSNYTIESLENFFFSKEKNINFQEIISTEVEEINKDIMKVKLEINFFDMYLKQYPTLEDKIIDFKKQSERRLNYLESQSLVLNKISKSI